MQTAEVNIKPVNPVMLHDSTLEVGEETVNHKMKPDSKSFSIKPDGTFIQDQYNLAIV